MEHRPTSRPYHFGALRDQFIASEHPLASLPDEWQVDVLNGWHLYRHPTTRMIPLQVADDVVGWLVGEAWEGSQMLRGPLVAPTQTALLDRLDELSGPMAAVVPHRFVRHDAMGQQSLVYSRDRRAVATNPLLIREACGGDLDAELVALMDIPNEDRWYPFGVTQVVGVRRLLPSHRLNLQTWEAVRYWPTPEDLNAEPASTDEAIEIVRRCVRDTVDALAGEHPLQLGLTAGHDSRAILACARKHGAGLVTATNIMHPRTEKVDHLVAQRLARIARVPHETREPQEATPEEQADFVDQTGAGAAGARYKHIALMNAFGSERVLLYGHGSEVFRGLYHNRINRDGFGVSRFRDPDIAFNLLRLPSSTVLRRAQDRWVHGLPACSDEAGLSLLYHEQRKGSWASVLRMSGRSRPIWAFAQRDLLRLMLRLPIETQISSEVLEGVIEREWPDLLRLPFNALPRPLWRKVASATKRRIVSLTSHARSAW